MKKKTLLNELTDKRNIFFNEEQSFVMTKTFTNLLFNLIIVFIITSLLLLVLDTYIMFDFDLSFNDYLSLSFGNICFYYCFAFIKERIVPYYSTNPLFLIGIIYPAFFNASMIQTILEKFGLIIDIRLLITILSIVIYYSILNIYYKKRWSNA